MHKIDSTENNYKKVLEFGPPKGGGKSTFSLYAPQPILILNYDGGNPQLPPGIEGKDVYVQNYPASEQEVRPDNHNWVKSKSVGGFMIQDILDVRNQLVTNKEVIKVRDWFQKVEHEIPRPATVILDGLVAFNTALLDWLMANEGMKSTGDAGKDALKFWGQRLDKMNTLFRFLLPLPANIILITWETEEMVRKAGDNQAQATGVKMPDIGGKMDKWAAGMVDATLYCYSQKLQDGTHYYVCTKPNNLVKCVGVRGRYDLPEAVDVTVSPAAATTKGFVSPWEKVWGKTVSTDKQLLKR